MNHGQRGTRRLLPLLLCALLGSVLFFSSSFLASCTAPKEDLLGDSLLVDSLTAAAVASEDTDITYAPVSASPLIDVSQLMTEDTTYVACDSDSLARTAEVEHLSLPRRIARWLVTPRDSLLRTRQDRFTPGSNFEVTDESLSLQQWPLTDEIPLHRGDEVVVAERMVVGADSAEVVWVKLARDQVTMGWVPEESLHGHLLPDDSVSRFIYFFSHSHGVMFMLVLGLFGLGFVWRSVRLRELHWSWFRQIDSIYSDGFLWLLATTAFLYALIQHFAPTVWEQFYYHPSLNPLDLAPLLSFFMLLVWGTVWVGVAVVDELYHQSRIDTAYFYGLALLSGGILLYLLFTYLPFYLGFPAWMAYSVLCYRRLRYHLRFRYICGKCGAKMTQKGVCPVCGTLNQ